MHKHLYDQFKHWYHNDCGSVWFYSDPHFSDEEMKYLRKNYIGDDEQVKRINSKIGKNDTLVILGDVGNTEYVKKLRGYKVLIMGNHDAGATNYQRIKQDIDIMDGHTNWKQSITFCDNHLFDEVYEGALIVSEKIILSHEPLDFPFALNIHGHDHSKNTFQDNLHINVCAENIDYTPVNLKWIIESGKLKGIKTIHRETIDTATKRKEKRKKNEGTNQVRYLD